MHQLLGRQAWAVVSSMPQETEGKCKKMDGNSDKDGRERSEGCWTWC